MANVLLLQTVMVLKYLIQGYPMPTLYFGIANVVANGLVMLRFVFLDLGLGVFFFFGMLT